MIPANRYQMPLEARQAVRALDALRNPFPRKKGQKERARRFLASMVSTAGSMYGAITRDQEGWIWLLVKENREKLDDVHYLEARRYWARLRGEDPATIQRVAS